MASQSVLTALDLALAVFLAGLLWTPVARTWIARLGIAGGAISMLMLAGLEVVSVAVGDSIDPGAWYGLASFGVGLALTWPASWRARTPMRTTWLGLTSVAELARRPHRQGSRRRLGWPLVAGFQDLRRESPHR